MKQAYLKLTAISNSDGDTVDAYIRHDLIGIMHVENGLTVVMHGTNGGVKVKESIQDILRMLESPAIQMMGDQVDVQINRHSRDSF